MPSNAEIYADSGDTSDIVNTTVPATDQWDQGLTLDIDRGTMIRLVNAVTRGELAGIPLYMDLRDSTGSPLPSDTKFRFAFKMAGSNEYATVSETVKNISKWHSQTLTEQRDLEKVDNFKVELQTPPSQGSQRLQNLTIRDIDGFAMEFNGSVAWDPAESAVYVDKEAVKGAFSRGD